MSAGSIRAGKAHVELSLKGQNTVMKSLSGFKVGMGNALLGVAKAGLAAAAAMTALATATAAVVFKQSIEAASKAQEVMSKFGVVFGDNTEAMKAWVDETAKGLGRAKSEIAGFAASSQDLLVPMGVDPAAAQEMSKTLVKLAIDLGSFNNVADADAMNDLQAALTGSGEVMKKYGVVLNQAAINQELFNQGIDPKRANEAQKAMARMNIIIAGTTAAQGDAARTADSYANSVKTMQANWEDFKVELGEKFLPLMTELATWVGTFVDAMTAATSTTDGFSGSMDGVVDGAETFKSVLEITYRVIKLIEAALYGLAGTAATLFTPLAGFVKAIGWVMQKTGLDETGAVMDAVDQWMDDTVVGYSEKAAAALLAATDPDTPQWLKDAEAAVDKAKREREAAREKLKNEGPIAPIDIGATPTTAVGTTEAEREEAARMDELKSRAESLAESLRTPLEIYNDTIKELEELVAKGLITRDLYLRAEKEAKAKLKSDRELLAGAAKKTVESIGQASSPETLLRGTAESSKAIQEWQKRSSTAEQELIKRTDEQIRILRKIEAKTAVVGVM